MIGIIDYGMGNLGSVMNAFRFLELDAKIVTRKGEMDACRAVLLPGVGAFGDCMAHLVEHDFVDAVRGWVASGKPLMGICLGLQALFDSSEETAGVPGLGIFPGTVKRFDLPPELKVPQIGWNQVEYSRPHPVMEGIEDQSEFYFVHSYYPAPENEEAIIGTTQYAGVKFASMVGSGNVVATQFHPEKSGRIGLKLLENFIKWNP